MEEILERIRMGGSVFEGLEKINAKKKLRIENLNEIFNTGKNFPFLDLDGSKEFLLTGRASRASIYKVKGEGLEWVKNLGTDVVKQACWLPLDASICFSVENDWLTMWDSNSGKIALRHFSQDILKVVPHNRYQTLALLTGERNSQLIDYLSGDLVFSMPSAYKVAQWSPAKDEFFVTGNENQCFLWDIRRLRSPIYSVGFLDKSGPYKKVKVENSVNVYDDFFYVQLDKNKSMMGKVLDLEFSQDGRKVLIKSQKGLFRADLMQAQEDPEFIVRENCKAGFVRDSELGILSAVDKGVVRYDENGKILQKLSFARDLSGLIEVNHLGVFYVVDDKCDVHKICVE